MINKLLSYLSPIIQVLTLVLVAILVFSGQSITLSGTTNYDALSLSETLNVSGTSTVGGLQIDTGSTIQELSCATLTTFNPGNLTTGATTTQDISLSGAAVGDICVASLASTSVAAAIGIDCQISGAGTSTITIKNDDVAVNFVTSTLRTCYLGF